MKLLRRFRRGRPDRGRLVFFAHPLKPQLSYVKD